jgi:hypothetical protein
MLDKMTIRRMQYSDDRQSKHDAAGHLCSLQIERLKIAFNQIFIERRNKLIALLVYVCMDRIGFDENGIEEHLRT